MRNGSIFFFATVVLGLVSVERTDATPAPPAPPAQPAELPPVVYCCPCSSLVYGKCMNTQSSICGFHGLDNSETGDCPTGMWDCVGRGSSAPCKRKSEF